MFTQIEMLQNTGQRFSIHVAKIKSKPEETQVPETERRTQGSSELRENGGNAAEVSLNIAAMITLSIQPGK